MIIKRLTPKDLALRRESGRARELAGILIDLEAGGDGVLIDQNAWGKDGLKAMHQLHTTRARVQRRQELLRDCVFRTERIDGGILIWRTA